MKLRRRIRLWLAKKFADKTLLEANIKLAETLLDQEKIIKSQQYSLIAVQEKLGGEVGTLYHLLKSLLLKEPDYNLVITSDLLATSQGLPDLNVVMNDSGDVILNFKQGQEE